MSSHTAYQNNYPFSQDAFSGIADLSSPASRVWISYPEWPSELECYSRAHREGDLSDLLAIVFLPTFLEPKSCLPISSSSLAVSLPISRLYLCRPTIVLQHPEISYCPPTYPIWAFWPWSSHSQWKNKFRPLAVDGTYREASPDNLFAVRQKFCRFITATYMWCILLGKLCYDVTFSYSNPALNLASQPGIRLSASTGSHLLGLRSNSSLMDWMEGSLCPKKRSNARWKSSSPGIGNLQVPWEAFLYVLHPSSKQLTPCRIPNQGGGSCSSSDSRPFRAFRSTKHPSSLPPTWSLYSHPGYRLRLSYFILHHAHQSALPVGYHRNAPSGIPVRHLLSLV